MTTRFHWYRRMHFAYFVFVCLFESTANATSNAGDKIQSDLVSWVRSKGGSFSDKLEIRRVDPEDPTSYMGVFVKDPIEAKESLFVIPRDCFIHVFDTAETNPFEKTDDTSYDTYHADLCKLANKLMGEMKLGDKSEYAPYIKYLQTQKPGQLPANWSPQGKELLREVATPGSSMVDWIDLNFRNCIGEKDDGEEISFEEHMVELTVQRCFDIALIPIWDMVNHDNGRINTENDSMYEKDGMKVRASRKLEKGEEIFSTYDACLDCKDLTEYWGTPEILKDFGFVENYPHRWIFSRYQIWFEVYMEEYGLDFESYFSGVKGGPPSKRQLEFLTEELARLDELDPLEQEDDNIIPDHEFNTIVKFHEVAMEDLEEVVLWFTKKAKEAADADADASNGEL